MSQNKSNLSSKDTLVATTYASAGLGHLRVVRALESALPSSVNPLLFRSLDDSVVGLHRIMSIHPILRNFMEWTQRGAPERLFSWIYLFFLNKGRARVRNNLVSAIVSQKAKKCVIVCTHFGLAHQIGSEKKEIEERTGTSVYLAVVVTDDSPQRLWAVPMADLICAPSHKTAKALKLFLPKEFRGRLVTISYPLSKSLSTEVSTKELENRFAQLSSDAMVHVSVPVSGAAVGLGFTKTLITLLRKKNDKYMFHVTTRRALYTRGFIKLLQARDYVEIEAYKNEYDVVEAYEALFSRKVISFEITKPSEQAFKSLLCPNHRGGVILLFTDPVGRQEYDNLDFLRRHGLMPTEEEHQKLYSYDKTNLTPSLWRAIRLPSNPSHAAAFIEWCTKEKIFSQMFSCRSTPAQWDTHAEEMGWGGANKFWEELEKTVL